MAPFRENLITINTDDGKDVKMPTESHHSESQRSDNPLSEPHQLDKLLSDSQQSIKDPRPGTSGAQHKHKRKREPSPSSDSDSDFESDSDPIKEKRRVMKQYKKFAKMSKKDKYELALKSIKQEKRKLRKVEVEKNIVEAEKKRIQIELEKQKKDLERKHKDNINKVLDQNKEIMKKQMMESIKVQKMIMKEIQKNAWIASCNCQKHKVRES